MALTINGFEVELSSTKHAPEDDGVNYRFPFNPSTKILEKGHKVDPDRLAFPVDVLLEQDFTIPMRDGIKLYCDIFRPTTSGKVPAIVMWSPYGKSANGPDGLDMMPGRFGVARERLSGYEKFEGLDPPVWVEKGYAVINVDLRGSWDSEGILPWLGRQDGKDGYDAIEYLASQEWSSGKICLAGNSWLCMSQWFIAAENPPHLAAFAPWEGASDFYRDTLCRGGVPYPYQDFWRGLEHALVGRNQIESAASMLSKYPLYNDYWEDKRAKLEAVTAPAYVLASYSTALHTSGSIRGYNDIKSSDKWLRIHPKQEWSDLYDPQNTDDLQKFFDYYAKDIQNGWIETPKVRVSLLGFDKPFLANVPFGSYPVENTTYTKLYFGSENELVSTPPGQQSSLSYGASTIPPGIEDGIDEIQCLFTFAEPTWLVGYSKAILYLSCNEKDDMDVFVQLRKVDASGKILQHMNVPLEDLVPPMSNQNQVTDSCFLKYLGPTGALRASHAVSKVSPDDEHAWPEYSNDKKVLITPGSIVRLEVPIWPGGIMFEKGDSLMVRLSGHWMNFMEMAGLNGKYQNENKGRHVLHIGGSTPSHIVFPQVQPKVI